MLAPSILVIGDFMLDRQIKGEMTRISPEAPAPVVLAKDIVDALGGAANVAANIAAMGYKVVAVGPIGNDSAGQLLVELLANQRHITPRLVVDGTSTTTVKTRITVGGQQVLRLDSESAHIVGVPTINLVMQHVHEFVAAANVTGFVISDYGKKFLLDTLVISPLLALARQAGLPVFVQCKPNVIDDYHSVTVLKINAREAEAYADLHRFMHPVMSTMEEIGRVDKALAIAQFIQSRTQITIVMVTCGSDGVVTSCGGAAKHHPTKPQAVFDVTGAGDTFLAAAVTAYFDRLGLDEAVAFCQAAAGLVVRQHGVVVATRDDVEDELLQLGGYAAKHMSPEKVVAFAARAKRRGKRIVVTNGAFDLLHPGHQRLLADAKQQGDVLIVLYNSDASVHKLKGEGRPCVPEDWRGVFLAINAYVDAVARFDDDTPAELIRQLHPDVLVKGGEYIGTDVPGADYVASRGGRVHFSPMLPHFSTSLMSGRPKDESPGDLHPSPQ